MKKADLQLGKQQIKTVDQKVVRTRALIDDLSKEAQRINQNTSKLVRLRNGLAKRPDADKLSVLMYTNIIQQNVVYATQLKDKITLLENDIIDLEMSKKNKENELKKIEAEIKVLTAKKTSLSPIEVVQAPVSSLKPVKPKTRMIVALGIVLGAFIGIFMAFVWEFIDSNREKITGAKGGR